MRLMNVVLASALGLALHAEASQESTCSPQDAKAAEIEASALKDWDSVYRSFKRFRHCDDGAVSEGYSDSIGQLLAQHWKYVTRLNSLVSANKRFERFVIKHIDDTVPAETLQKIAQNAHSNCPKNSERLCKLIEGAAR